MEKRFPILDVDPVVRYGEEIIPTKAIANESISVRATVIREGRLLHAARSGSRRGSVRMAFKGGQGSGYSPIRIAGEPSVLGRHRLSLPTSRGEIVEGVSVVALRSVS